MDSSNLHGLYSWTPNLRGVYYGPGCVKTALPKLLKIIGGRRALVVTGKTLHTKTDIVRRVENVLEEYGAYGGTFWGISEHSPIASIRAGVQAFKDARADLIVTVGGGSPVDAAKAILHFVQREVGGRVPPQIAIPTTLSAAEYTFAAGYMNEEGVKILVASPEFVPSGIILDAELTLATPERLWLSTGMRAVDHAVENLYRAYVPPPVKHLCHAALGDLFKYLPQSKANPQDVAIRQKLQIASWMSMWPIQQERSTYPGLSHTIGHRLGSFYGIPHGITSCLTLARVVALQAEILPEDDKEWLAGALHALRQPPTGSIEGDIHRLSDLINDLVIRLGLESSLVQYNVPREDIPTIAEKALVMRGRNDPIYPKVVRLLEGMYPK